MAETMHAAILGDPFGGTVCGAPEGWRTQVGTDVTCRGCLDRLTTGEEETHLGMWAAEMPLAAQPSPASPDTEGGADRG